MNIVLSNDVLSLSEAFLDAFTVILVVFGVLFIMFVLISLSGKVFSSMAPDKKAALTAKAPAAAPAVAAAAEPVKEEEFSSGTLKLKGCDEKTAAMIMAIVSDNTGIPLSELVFKSITLVEEK
ncbi:Oxaloacetate decarboxylase, gamma chain [Ruminococcaceae bacterium KH2T8]|nr:Oxaloacetate decarboxylase, gamma chain [Ruminococcaceae bacterium KH2T8]